MVYLDDGLCAANSYSSASDASAIVRRTLDCAGFVTHPTKCEWEPTQSLGVAWVCYRSGLRED